jgi:RNA-directed DNA polymerase
LKNNNKDVEEYVFRVKSILTHVEDFILTKTNTLSDINSVLINAEYIKFKITKKKSSLKRLISVPPKYIKFSQGQFLPDLNALYNLIKPNYVYGYVGNQYRLTKSYNIQSNAQNHLSKNWVLNIDLSNFFASIKKEKIFQLFIAAPFNFSKKEAEIISNLTTHNGELPIGSPTSPILSNLVFLKVDKELIKLASKFNLTYTRYADDLTFSSNQKPSEYLINNIISIITKHGYEINFKKINLKSKNERQEVTGLVVNKKLNLKNEYYKLVRAILFNLKKDYNASREKYIETYRHQYNRHLKNYYYKNRTKYSYFDEFSKDIHFNPELFYSEASANNFINLSLAGKIKFIQSILGSENPRVLILWKLYNSIFELVVDNKPIIPSKIAFITNATAKSVVFYAYLYLKSNKIEEPEILKLISDCTTNNYINYARLEDKFISQAASFISLYDYLKSNNRFENFINANISSGNIDKIVKYWENRKNTFLPKFYRQIFHVDINCDLMRKDYNEGDGIYKNTGVLAHNQNNQSDVIYTVNKEFLENLGMRCCVMCSR